MYREWVHPNLSEEYEDEDKYSKHLNLSPEQISTII